MRDINSDELKVLLGKHFTKQRAEGFEELVSFDCRVDWHPSFYMNKKFQPVFIIDDGKQRVFTENAFLNVLDRSYEHLKLTINNNLN